MDLYSIHKLYPAGDNSYGSASTSEKSLWDTHFQDREELARFLNMLTKTQLMEPPNLRGYDISYDDLADDKDQRNSYKPSSSSSTDFNASLLSPFGRRPVSLSSSNSNNSSGPNNNHSSGSTPRVTLADQFTWGAVVCAGVFIVVFVCVMAAWWVHKRQQDQARRRLAQLESRRQSSSAPYCIENDSRNGSVQQGEGADVQARPPSYFEVIGFFDPPPSYDTCYNDVLRVSGRIQQDPTASPQHHQGYDNVAVTIDEMPPPFAEGDYVIKTDNKPVVVVLSQSSQQGQTSAILTSEPSVVTVIPNNNTLEGDNSLRQ